MIRSLRVIIAFGEGYEADPFFRYILYGRVEEFMYGGVSILVNKGY